MKSQIAIVLWAFLLIVLMASAQRRPPVSGHVLDSEGAAIEHARILVHWDSSGSTVGLSSNVGVKRDISIQTDKNGRFEITLPSGFYDLFVSSPAFSPVALKIRVRGGIAAPLEIRLHVDPFVSKELGHDIQSPNER
jgi:hypothetical protein